MNLPIQPVQQYAQPAQPVYAQPAQPAQPVYAQPAQQLPAVQQQPLAGAAGPSYMQLVNELPSQGGGQAKPLDGTYVGQFTSSCKIDTNTSNLQMFM